jgi:predicted  nucleic acid-binding Zn-ribbon protein
MNKSMNLYLLQQTDLKLDQYAHRIQEIEAIVADQTEHDQAANGLKQIHDKRITMESKLRGLEDRIKTTRIKTQQSEGSLYGGKIQNPKELQDLQTEIAILKKHIAELEDTEFDQMVLLEDITTQENDAIHHLEIIDQHKQENNEQLMVEVQTIRQLIEKVLPEKNAMMASVDAPVLEIYLKLRKTKAGIAVTQVEDNTCEKCGAEITQAEWQKARISQDLCYCATCGRIIYAK